MAPSSPNQKPESCVRFVDGTSEDIDAVILGTGYLIQFPFLSEDIVQVNRNHVSLYKYVFPPEQDSPTLAIIGLAQPIGSTIPIAEIQARWATRVFKGLARLPSRGAMLADIERKRAAMKKRYVTSQRHTIQVDFLPYMDEVAREFGVKPNFLKMFLTDTGFWVKNFFGLALNYQFRLEGPGRWEGAREAIETYWERVEAPFGTREVTDVIVPPRSQQSRFKLVIIPIAVLLVTYWMRGWPSGRFHARPFHFQHFRF